jgi:hypothetical protein
MSKNLTMINVHIVLHMCIYVCVFAMRFHADRVLFCVVGFFLARSKDDELTLKSILAFLSPRNVCVCVCGVSPVRLD